MKSQSLPVLYQSNYFAESIAKRFNLELVVRPGGMFDGKKDPLLDILSADETEIREYMLGMMTAHDNRFSGYTRSVDRESFHPVETSPHFWRGFFEAIVLYSCKPTEPRLEFRSISMDVMFRLLDFIGYHVDSNFDQNCVILKAVLLGKPRITIRGRQCQTLLGAIYGARTCKVSSPRLAKMVEEMLDWEPVGQKDRIDPLELRHLKD